MALSEDEEFKIVSKQYPGELEVAINELLTAGRWRIVETEMSVTDHHYYVMMVRSKTQPRITEGNGEE